MATPAKDRAAVEQEEFRRIYREEFVHVWHSLRRHGVSERNLEDAAHEVFLVLHRRLPELDRTRSLRPYLSAIASRVASEHRRRAAERYEALSDEVESVDPTGSPEELIAAGQRRRLVHRALEGLSREQRAVFVMHDIEGHPMPDIAAALEIKLNTAYSRLRLGREAFGARARQLQKEER
jgi:RNA polymerase sigma-70 factor (ECF subfamily)